MSLSYILGAAVLFFELPTSTFLQKAFIGAQAWVERQQGSGETRASDSASITVSKDDRPDKTYDGFTLYTSDWGSKAWLINMSGEVVHKWAIPFRHVWRNPPHLRDPVADAKVSFWGWHLYPNGDLLVVFQGTGDTPYGYGLVKLDRDSNVLWRYAANVHHEIDVAEDGTIYALTQQIVNEVPKGLEFIPTPCVVDYLVLLSSAGEELKKIPILEAFRDSRYAFLLTTLGRRPKQRALRVPIPDTTFDPRGDILHTNFVHILTPKRSPKFPRFKAGQVLICVRRLDAIAVLDPERCSVVWAACGPWRGQHGAQFLDNGRILIFDNVGSLRWSRVLEYEPDTQAFPWSYPGEDNYSFISYQRGMCQRLPNGNTLIVNSEGGEIIEVTRSKEVVWSCECRGHIASARRYAPSQLHFLKGGQRARP
jgi:hypothetical protein